MVRPAALVRFGLVAFATTAAGLLAAAEQDFLFPSTGVKARGRVVLLAIDDQSLPLRENVVQFMSRPRCRPQPVLSPDKDNPHAPDQVAAHFYGAVLHDQGKFRMWYYAVGMREPGDARRPDLQNLTQGPVCYAESQDGIIWTKPSLGQVEFRGRKDNNAIALPDARILGVYVMRDDDDPDPARRYKMAYNPHTGEKQPVRTATSPDGLHWDVRPDFAINDMLELCSLYRFNDYYVVHGQRLRHSEGGYRGGRQGRAVVAPRFDQWLPGEFGAFLLPEPADPAARGRDGSYDQVHLGVGATSLGNVCVGLYGLWHNLPGDESDRKRWGWFGYGKTSCDLGLVISNDGMHFREPVKGHVFISRHDAPATPVPGRNYPTILVQSGNGIINVGDETRIYFGRWRNAEYGMGYHGEVALAVLPRDRWGAVGLYPAPQSQGAGFGGRPRAATGPVPDRGFAWSAPVRLPEMGCRVLLNADGAAGLSVEISDERFELLPGFAGANAGRTPQAEGLDCAVTWPAGSLASLGGRTVRFKINLERGAGVDPRLFAAYLQPN